MRQVREPALTSPTEADWQYELANRTHGRMNYISIDIDLVDHFLKAGSQAVVGGALYEATANEGWTSLLYNFIDNYLILTPNGASTVGPLLSVTRNAPVWDAARGGYYYADGGGGAARALAKMRLFNGSLSFVTLARKEDLYVDYPLPSPLNTASGGTLVHTGAVNAAKYETLAAGTYRIEVVGGKGGNGAKANNADGNGGNGANGQKITKILTSDKTTYYTTYVGGDGNDADPNSYTGAGGGGPGGASGMDSLFALYDTDGIEELILALGGSAGGGGQNSNADGGGGAAGGSRYGQAENGWNYNNTAQNNGQGGIHNHTAEGGAARGDGGKGGNGGNSATDYNGGAGEAGNGAGGNASGGYGGKATVVKVAIMSKFDKYGYPFNETVTLISCGGGGAGGNGEHVNGRAGAGASGVKSTSSGYVKVYRLW